MNGLANRRLQPLGHVSDAEIIGFIGNPPTADPAHSANGSGLSSHKSRHSLFRLRSVRNERQR